MRRLLLAATAAATLSAGAAMAQTGVPLIPRDVLFGNPERAAAADFARRQMAELDRAGRRRDERLGRAGVRPRRAPRR